MGKSTSAFHLRRDLQRCEVPLLLCLDCQRSGVPLSVLPLGQDFQRSHSFSALVLPGVPNMGKSTSVFHLCQDVQRCEGLLPHFCSALTANHMKFSFRTSALAWLLKVSSFASAIPLCLYCQRSEIPLSVLRLGQDFERSRSSSARALPGLPNMGKSTFAFHLCRDFQRSEVLLPHSCFALTAKDVKFCFHGSAVCSYIMHSHTNLYCL